MTNSQSKDAFVNDTTEEDLIFIDDEGEKLFLIDEDIICGCGCGSEIVDNAGETKYSVIINIMKRRYFWYMGEKAFSGELSWIAMLKKAISQMDKNDENQLARKLYVDLDYPIMRDATCPYKCEGCQVMKQCLYCADCVSMCQANTNTNGKIIEYFCGDECFSVYYKNLYTGFIQNSMERLYEATKYQEIEVQAIKFELLNHKSNKKLVRMKILKVNEKDSILKSDLVQLLKDTEQEVKEKMIQLQCYGALLNKDLPVFETTFAKIQEYYVDALSSAEDDKELKERADGTKHSIKQLKSYANILLGTEYDL